MAYIVGSNVSGYLPDTEPTDHDSEGEARSAMIAELAETWRCAGDDVPESAFHAALDTLAAAPLGFPVSIRFAGRVHFLDFDFA